MKADPPKDVVSWYNEGVSFLICITLGLKPCAVSCVRNSVDYEHPACLLPKRSATEDDDVTYADVLSPDWLSHDKAPHLELGFHTAGLHRVKAPAKARQDKHKHHCCHQHYRDDIDNTVANFPQDG